MVYLAVHVGEQLLGRIVGTAFRRATHEPVFTDRFADLVKRANDLGVVAETGGVQNITQLGSPERFERFACDAEVFRELVATDIFVGLDLLHPRLDELGVRLDLTLRHLGADVGEFLRRGLVELELLGNRGELGGSRLVEFHPLGHLQIVGLGHHGFRGFRALRACSSVGRSRCRCARRGCSIACSVGRLSSVVGRGAGGRKRVSHPWSFRAP